MAAGLVIKIRSMALLSQHQVDNRVYAQSYGLKWQGEFSFGIGPAGLNDVNIDLGVARVEGDDFENDLRAWLSFYYSL